PLRLLPILVTTYLLSPVLKVAVMDHSLEIFTLLVPESMASVKIVLLQRSLQFHLLHLPQDSPLLPLPRHRLISHGTRHLEQQVMMFIKMECF
ncbi:TPA: hypothetical protein DHT69_01780, partial [Candidatus Collierbacteria bacterium]|nr:hypothetical protein [Candidatus Collierbacteria bacterium]